MNKPYSDSTLMSMTKRQLIEQIRILENNIEAVEERTDRQYKLLTERYFKDEYKKLKITSLIEYLNAEINQREDEREKINIENSEENKQRYFILLGESLGLGIALEKIREIEKGER
jgi:hypothetical protein